MAAGIGYAWPDGSSILCHDNGRWVILLGIAAIAPASAFRHMHSVSATIRHASVNSTISCAAGNNMELITASSSNPTKCQVDNK